MKRFAQTISFGGGYVMKKEKVTRLLAAGLAVMMVAGMATDRKSVV